MSENMKMVDPESSVKVAVRIRPQNSREIIDMCRICTSVTPREPQIILGSNKAFTFDFLFDVYSNQNDIYSCCVEKLVQSSLNGYNATVLAYGQTGSGKTFTMGTGFERDICDEQIGIIPRAICNIFNGIENLRQQSEGKNVQFSIAIQFMELYNEDIVDLLDPYNKAKLYRIHEDSNGQISISGVTVKTIDSPQDALKYLRQGALARSTASTQMNDQSSRSHALFTILIKRQQFVSTPECLIEDDIETLTSKFHFVDLAGSERLKRTGATGDRAREGISINCGLLALGNCISALGDKSKKATHIPYRDSKLTRLLQDSLGGNSQTLMIACVSPSDRDFMETLNTLKYANRAKNIKNKILLNRDKSSQTISQLRGEIASLQLELLELKQGKRFIDKDGVSSHSDTFHENILLTSDNKRLQCRIKAMQETINILSEKNAQLKIEKEIYKWSQQAENSGDVKNMVSRYLNEIEKLQTKLIETEEMYKCIKNDVETENSQRGANKTKSNIEDATNVIMLAKREIENDINTLRTQAQTYNTDVNNSKNPSIDDTYLSGESDDESEDQKKIQADLFDINSNIEIKTKLLEQLELSQQRLQLMRKHYEEKLAVLQCTITNTQKERDEVLSAMTKNNLNQPNERSSKIRDDYELKLNDLQREVKKLQHAEREHIKQQRNVKSQEIQLRNLRNELDELKFIKTRLMRKISDQFKCHKESETKKSREILQLRKEQRRQENTVKSLQTKIIAKEQILKRKTEEVFVLRRNQRLTLSQRASGRVFHKDQIPYNSKLARQKWENIRRGLTRAARSKHVVLQLEKELNRLISERDSLCYALKNIQYRQDVNDLFELRNEEDTIKSNLSYIQENITQLQQSIIELEDGEDSCTKELQYLHELIASIGNVNETKFLIDCLLDNAIAITCNSIFCENKISEQKSLLKQVKQESNIRQQLLEYFLAQNSSFDISNIFDSLNIGSAIMSLNVINRSQHSVNSNDTYDIPSTDRMEFDTTICNQKSRSQSPASTKDLNPKVRKRTAHREDLLFGNGDDTKKVDYMTRSFQQLSRVNNVYPLTRVPSAPGSLK